MPAMKNPLRLTPPSRHPVLQPHAGSLLQSVRIRCRPDGETGRHKGLKIPRPLRLCRFDSGSGYHDDFQRFPELSATIGNFRKFQRVNRTIYPTETSLLPTFSATIGSFCFHLRRIYAAIHATTKTIWRKPNGALRQIEWVGAPGVHPAPRSIPLLVWLRCSGAHDYDQRREIQGDGV